MKLIASAFQPVSVPSIKTPEMAFWFAVSFISPLYFGLVSLFHATSFRYIVQDDARLHIVWLQRLTDPALFPNDFIADYFGIIQPAGFQWLYGLAASLGIEALTFAKILPLFLALITTAYLFWVALIILPVPISGVLTTLLLNQNIWIRDDLISAAPRAFVYPIFAAFLYYLLRDSKVGYLVSLSLLGLFYPQMMLIAIALLTLRLVKWQKYSPKLSRNFRDYAVWLIALAITGTLLLTFSHRVAVQVGQLATLEEMKTLPEFQLGGRGEYFGVSFQSFWFDGSSGVRFPLLPPVILLGILLPFVVRRTQPSGRLAAQITPQVRIIGQLLVCAIALFLTAHLIFPTLYLPSRYTFYSSRFVLILASGTMLTLVSHRWLRWLIAQAKNPNKWKGLNPLRLGASTALAIAILTTPAVPLLFLGGQGWRIGEPVEIFEHLARSPKDSLVASLVTEINDNVPAFSQRSVLVGREFALPFHTDFYAVLAQRMRDLVRSQYTPNPTVLRTFIQTYGIDSWIIAKDFTNPEYLDQQTWLLNSSAKETVIEAKTQLQQGIQPAILRSTPTCTTFEKANLIVLDVQCVTRTID